MLKSLGLNRTRSHLPALIKSVGGDISLPSPLVSASPEQAAVQSIFSPPSQFNKGPSPPPGRTPLRADAYTAQPLRLENTAALSIHHLMELPESTRSTDGRQTSWTLEKSEPRSMVVAMDANRELQVAPLKYALENFVKPGDTLHLLGILQHIMNPSTSPPRKSTPASIVQNILGYKQRADPRAFNGTNKLVIQEEIRKKKAEFEREISENSELQKLFDLKQVTPEVHIAAGPDRKAETAKQAVELRATWIILDKHLKNDKTFLMEQEQLNCNLVLMKPKNQAIIFKVALPTENLPGSPGPYQLTLDKSIDLGPAPMSDKALFNSVAKEVCNHLMSEPSSANVCSTSPPQHQEMTILTQTTEEYSRAEGQPVRADVSYTSSSSAQVSDRGEDDLTAAESDHDGPSELGPPISHEGEEEARSQKPEPEDDTLFTLNHALMVGSVENSPSDAFYKIPGRPSMSTGDLQSLVPKSGSSSAATLYRPSPRSASDRAGDELMNILNPAPSTPPGPATPKSVRTLQRSLRDEDLDVQSPTLNNGPIGRLSKFGSQNEESNRLLLDNSVHSRRKTPRPVAPLCSRCKKPGPVFGSDARRFSYAELEEATNNFDQESYIAEGGYGFVYRGRLKEGLEIAVKQYKSASSQGDDEFYSEVEVLKHAQHRNLVILIGYCTENQRRLLVYEFVCNKSLDVHLSAKNVNVLEWKSRWKIAVGAARGLRYLHEECRVGCIVHRDMRPNNILLTHDFVPMVGDFGLARSQPSGDEAEETRVIGTLGYLAPEYAESGSITEKADVYSFGVVLLELITGRKAIDATRARGETCLTEWARPMIQAGRTRDIVDPRLKDDYDVEQVEKMVEAAGRCISKDPAQRPKMSEVLRLLERDANSNGSLSRGNSNSDLSEVTRTTRDLAKLALRADIRRQDSLDSISTKGNGASSYDSQSNHAQSTPITIEKPRKKENKSQSERIDRTSSNSPGGKSASSKASSNSPSSSRSVIAKGKTKLSYDDML